MRSHFEMPANIPPCQSPAIIIPLTPYLCLFLFTLENIFCSRLRSVDMATEVTKQFKTDLLMSSHRFTTLLLCAGFSSLKRRLANSTTYSA